MGDENPLVAGVYIAQRNFEHTGEDPECTDDGEDCNVDAKRIEPSKGSAPWSPPQEKVEIFGYAKLHALGAIWITAQIFRPGTSNGQVPTLISCKPLWLCPEIQYSFLS